jgi:hypothetical protein
MPARQHEKRGFDAIHERFPGAHRREPGASAGTKVAGRQVSRESTIMPFRVLRCPVVGWTVTQVTDLEGRTTAIICDEYDRETDACRAKARAIAGGPLSQFLERVAEETLASRSMRCDLV